jgi:hypothetical protein
MGLPTPILALLTSESPRGDAYGGCHFVILAYAKGGGQLLPLPKLAHALNSAGAGAQGARRKQ